MYICEKFHSTECYVAMVKQAQNVVKRIQFMYKENTYFYA